MADKVGIVGVGAMGQALLSRLIAAGKQVKAYDVVEASLKAAREAGAETVESPAEAARDAAYVHLFVRTDEEVEHAALGADGVLAGASAGMFLLLHSTIHPDTSRRVAEEAAKQEVKVIDAPVTAIPRRVYAGEAAFLVGGPDDIVEAVRPHLEAIGGAVYHFGPLGAGNAAKIAKNLITAAERVLLAESAWIAEAAGLDPKQLLDMMKAQESDSLISRWERAYTVEDGHVEPKPTTNLLDKDIRLAAELGRSLGLDLPVTYSAANTAAKWVDVWKKE